MKKVMRQVAGAFAEFEKARLVAKLRHARDRKRDKGERVEGRPPAHELYPKAVTEAKRLRRASPKTGERMSFRDISARLAKDGIAGGGPFGLRIAVLALPLMGAILIGMVGRTRPEEE